MLGKKDFEAKEGSDCVSLQSIFEFMIDGNELGSRNSFPIVIESCKEKQWGCCQTRSTGSNSNLEIISIHGGTSTSMPITVHFSLSLSFIHSFFFQYIMFSFSCLIRVGIHYKVQNYYLSFNFFYILWIPKTKPKMLLLLGQLDLDSSALVNDG